MNGHGRMLPGRAALLAVGVLAAASCSAPLTPPYIDIRNPEKAVIVSRVVDNRQIVLTGRHVDRYAYRKWYHPQVWFLGDSLGTLILETEKCGRLGFRVVDSRYASCGTQCRPPVEPIPKNCPLTDEATREQWGNAQWRIIE